MNNLTEKHHAFLVGSYYTALKENFQQEGLKIFTRATRRYAEQRGHRMGLRADRNGYKRDFLGYFTHSEWTPTYEMKPTRKLESNGDLIVKIEYCAWHSTFIDMNIQDCGELYCNDIDQSLLRGFNPELVLDLTSLLYTSDNCTHCYRKAMFNPISDSKSKEAADKFGLKNKKLFDYHTGHIYKTFKEVIMEDLGTDGEKVIEDALISYENKYSKDSLETILSFENTDFDQID